MNEWEWAEWVAWGTSIALGGYGALRSYRTDRKLKLTEQDWKIEFNGGDSWRLTNISHRRLALKEIRLPDYWTPGKLTVEDDENIKPNDFAVFITARTMNATSDRLVLNYRIRGFHLGRRTRQCILPIPLRTR